MGRRRNGSSDSMYAQLEPLGDHRNLAEEAYHYLYSAIHGLKIKPGEELNEVWLAERLHVSVTPVREALLRLAGDGLVVREPRHQPRVVQLTRREIEEIYDVRGALESFAAAEAAGRVTEKDIARLTTLHENGQRVAGEKTSDRYDSYNDELHQAIMRLAGNNELLRMMRPIRVKMRLCMHLTSMLPGRRLHGLTEHKEIIGRLAAHDSFGAAETMRKHCDSAKRSYLEHYEKIEGASPPARRPRGRPRRETN